MKLWGRSYTELWDSLLVRMVWQRVVQRQVRSMRLEKNAEVARAHSWSTMGSSSSTSSRGKPRYLDCATRGKGAKQPGNAAIVGGNPSTQDLEILMLKPMVASKEITSGSKRTAWDKLRKRRMESSMNQSPRENTDQPQKHGISH